MPESSIIDGELFEYHIIDGKKFRLLGYVVKDGMTSCPTEKCGAYCCQTGSLFADAAPPCSYLKADLKCYFHARGGMSAKPLGCTVYPRHQADIDYMNRNAVGDEGCPLKFEAVP